MLTSSACEALSLVSLTPLAGLICTTDEALFNTHIVVVVGLQGHNYATKRGVPVPGSPIGAFAFVLSKNLATTPRLMSSVPTPRSTATGELG